MNIWNNYITSVRTKIQVKQDKKLLTERQWKLKHFVKINDKCGKYLWVNAYCPNQELYLWDEEVRKMTDEELATYRAEEKEKQNENSLNPKTGDNINMLLWASLLSVSLIGMLEIAIYNRKIKLINLNTFLLFAQKNQQASHFCKTLQTAGHK